MPIDLATMFLVGAVVLTIALAGFVALRPSMTRGVAGKVVAFVALFVLPVATVWGGFSLHMETSKSTEFCLSCHNMEPYGTTLLYDDTDYLAAGHYQNRRIDREHACFTCHTNYTLFGDYKAKLAGLKHVWVYYLGDPPEAGEIELYQPYDNGVCLSCHAGARAFVDMHEDDMESMRAGELSCLECHEWVHDAEDAGEQELWTDSVEATVDPYPLGGE